MSRLYWLGLGLVFLGTAVHAVPLAGLRAVLFGAGLVVQVAGVICIFTALVRHTRGGKKLDRKRSLLLGFGLGFFVLGVIVGVLLTP